MLRQQNSIISSIDTHTVPASAKLVASRRRLQGPWHDGAPMLRQRGGSLALAPSHVEDLVSKELAAASSLSSSFTLFTPAKHERESHIARARNKVF